MSDLSELLEQVGEQVQQSRAERDAKIASGVVDASGGELDGFTTESGTNETGEMVEQTTFHRAKRNVNLAAGMNSEAAGAAVRASIETGYPVNTTMQWDNQRKKHPDVSSLSSDTQEFLGENLVHAAVSRDDEENIDALIQTAKYALSPLAQRRQQMQDDLRGNGYSATQLADLAASGIRPADGDPTGKKGVFHYDVGGEDRTTEWPMLEKWYENPVEQEFIGGQRKAADELVSGQYDDKRGSAWLLMASPEEQANYIRQLDKEIAVMKALSGFYGDAWANFSDGELQHAINTVGNETGVDVSDVSVKRLRPEGVGWQTDWAETFNFFGIQDFWKRMTGPSKEELDRIHKDPLWAGWSVMDRLDLIDELEQQAMDYRGKTLANSITEGTLTSVKFGLELWAGGVGQAYEAATSDIFGHGLLHAVKSAPKAFWGLMKAAAGIAPGRSITAVDTALEKVGGQISATIQDGEVVPEYDVGEVGDLAKEIVNAFLDQYIEDVSEGVGEMLPPIAILGRAVPKKLQRAAFVKAAKETLQRYAGKQGVKQVLDIMQKMGWHGIPAEWFEEIMGDVMRYGVTGAAEALGTGVGDLGQNTVFNGWDAEAERLLQIAVTGTVIPAVAYGASETVNALNRMSGAHNAKQFQAAVSTLKERVDAASTTNKRSPEIMEYLLRKTMGTSGFAYLTPEMAGTYFQSMPDTMRAIGVTEEIIGRATTEERLVPVSVPALLVRGSAEEVNQVLEGLIPDPKNMLTPGDADKVLPSEMDAAMQKSAEELKDKDEAIQEKMDELRAAGRPDSEIRAFSKLLQFAEYFAAHNTDGMTAAEWIRNFEIKGEAEADFLKRLGEAEPSLYQGVIGIPGFYSNMMQSLADAPQQKMTPAQWMAYLQKSGGLKAGETSWRGSVEKFFEGRDPKTAVDRQELVDAFENGMVDILETSWMDPEPTDYTMDWAASMFNNSFIGKLYRDEEAERQDLMNWVQEASTEEREARYDELRQHDATWTALKDLRKLLVDVAKNGFNETFYRRLQGTYEYLTPEKVQEYIDAQRAMFHAHDLHWREHAPASVLRDADNHAKGILEEIRRVRGDINRKVDEPFEGNSIRENYTTDGLDRYGELVIYSPEIDSWDPSDEIHFGETTNGTAIAWVRFGETTDKEGNRVLVIDEIQSNRHQAGREQGYMKKMEPDGEFGTVGLVAFDDIQDDLLNGGKIYWYHVRDAETYRKSASFGVNNGIIKSYQTLNGQGNPEFEALIGKDTVTAFGEDVAGWMDRHIYSDQTGMNYYPHDGEEAGAVPPAPFEKNWHELGMKRMIRFAAEHGYDKIAWTGGTQQAKRYNLGKVVQEIVRGGSHTLWVDDIGLSWYGYDSVEDIEELGFNHDEAMFLYDLTLELNVGGRSIQGIIDEMLELWENHQDKLEFGIGALREFAKRIRVKGTGRSFFARTNNHPFSFRVLEDGKIVDSEIDNLEGQGVFEVFGKELGTKILDIANDKATDDRVTLDEDTVIGGEGMKTFYDKILKNFTEKYIKKWGSKVGVVELPEVEEAGREMWGFDVTPAMKAAVMGRGQPLFQSDPWIRKLYGDVNYAPRIHRPTNIKIDPELQAQVDKQREEVRAKYEGTDQWMKAPNGKPSNLPEDLWVTVRTPYFKAWFGDWEKEGRRDARPTSGDSVPITPAQSRASMDSHPYSNYTPGSGKSQVGILDLNGEPLVLYHGTQNRFGKFLRGDAGFHYGTKEQASDRVTEINVLGKRGELKENAGLYAGFVNLRNPLYIPADTGSFEPWSLAVYFLQEGRTDLPMNLTPEDEKYLNDLYYTRTWTLSDDDRNEIRAKFRSWLQSKGYDGIVYENNVEGTEVAKSFVILDPNQFKEAENFGTFGTSNWFYYQSKVSEPHRGAITFNEDFKATITLFEGAADGSTVVHETAHYVFDMMEHFVESGIADERMQSDFRKLQAWATLSMEQAAKGYEAYLKTVPEGTDAMTLAQWTYIEEQERIARGFEAYCLEGRAPSVELQGAFATLRRILLHIYKTVRALGVQLTDDVRQVFDGMLATETTLLRDSILLEAAAQIDRELLGLSQSEVKVFRDLIQKSNEQAVQEMTAEKNRQLTELRKQWRKEAKELMDGDPVYSVWYAVQKEGKMDYLATEEIAGEYIAQRLRAMGLVTNPGRKSKERLDKDGNVVRPAGYYSAKSGKHPATLAAQAGFESVEDMIDQLLASKSPQDFTAEYMADEEKKFNAEFEMSEKAQSVQASIEALEKLSEMLAVKGGQIGYRFRRALLKQQALEELNRMSVSHIVSDKKLIADCRMNARSLTKAANEGDFKTAFEHAKALRFNLEVLRMKGDARKSVADGVALLRKGRHAKKGTIYGDHQEALMDLSFRFGFTNNLPKIQHTVASVVAEFNEEAAANGDMPLDVPDWMLNFSMDYRKMTFGQFQELKNLAEFLYGEGKELVSAREETFRNSVKAAVEGTVAELKDQKHKYTRSTNFVVKGWRGMVNWGTKLRNIVGMATDWNPDSTLQKLYDEMAFAESEQTQVMAEPMRQCTAALDALYKATRGLNLEAIADIPFPQDVKAEGYRQWDAEKVVAACLNMGTLKNKQRLIDGYEWGEKGDEYVSRIASLLTAEDWASIQAIWDAMAQLTPRTAQTFKEEYHYDLKLEEAAPFTVDTKDGQEIDVRGGYYPLEYLYHKNTVVNDKVDALKNAPKFRRASFTFERNEQVTDPLTLSLNTVFNHIFDASHYISHRHVMRKVLRVINDRAFRSHFQQTQGFERYAALKALIENVAAPGAALKGMTSEFENWGRAVVTASALWASPSVVAMQLSSITYGIDELGGYYLEAASENMAHPVDTFKFVMAHSGMMRDRVNLKDLDLKMRANEFRQNQAQHIRSVVTQIGYSPMRFVDLAVAIPAWKAAYDKALDEGKSDSHAVAAADEFVAKTQGATRAIDLSPLQLKPWGRGLTVFFSAVSAGSTMGTKTISKVFGGKMSAGEAAYSATMNLVLPLLFSCLVRYAVSGAGGGDPDKARRAFLRELMTNPFQGVPVLRDVADFAAGRVLNPSGKTQRTVFENTSLRGASDLVVTAFDGVEAAFEENPDRAMYKLADAVGTLFQVPAVRVYERLRQMLVDWTGDEKILPDIDEETKHKKSNKKRRRH